MSEEEIARLSVEELIALVLELREQVERLAKEHAVLKHRLEENERSSKRQAAPFSKGEKKVNPKKPGRKPGKGKFSRRDPPPEEEITHRVQVPLQGDRCAFCGSSNLGEVRIECAFCTDIAETAKPKVTAYYVEVRQCLDCGHTIRGQHSQSIRANTARQRTVWVMACMPVPTPCITGSGCRCGNGVRALS